ncbi:sugar transferase [Parabacteroides sp. ZJ-118]|uniref:sugar transferase n=1 Tax=Parabacteroides sp. ZJ-118 TaxID=2709398 RepID=UPI0013E9DC1D|nr:sugar transferase [Parabacteroides sp. ZJ-118]
MYLVIKRFFDFFISFATLLFLFPLLIVVAVLIKLDSRGPIFYLQNRVGKNGHLFRVYKFRTMTNKRRDPNAKQTFLDDPDITRMGGFLRRFKIDELPQIWNVFVGDMSLVGPRPALPGLYEKYGELANKRCSVRPGMTGWAQVNGNIYLPWEKRLRLDSEYVDRVSFPLDLRILIKTVAIVLFGEEKYIKK